MPKTADSFMTDLHTWIDEAAGKLQRNLHDGYTTGYEYQLADDIAGRADTDEHREAAMRCFITEWLMSWPAVGGVLDETADETYALMTEVAARIADLSWQQMQAEGSDLRFRRMIAEEICQRQRCLALL